MANQVELNGYNSSTAYAEALIEKAKGGGTDAIDEICSVFHEATGESWGTDEDFVDAILSCGDDELIADVMDRYSDVTGSEITLDVENDYSGSKETEILTNLYNSYSNARSENYTGWDDGKISTSEKASNIAKGAAPGVATAAAGIAVPAAVSAIAGTAAGSAVVGAVASTAVGSLVVAGMTVAAPVLAAVGIGVGIFMIGRGIYKAVKSGKEAQNAQTDTEAKQAYQNVGEGLGETAAGAVTTAQSWRAWKSLDGKGLEKFGKAKENAGQVYSDAKTARADAKAKKAEAKAGATTTDGSEVVDADIVDKDGKVIDTSKANVKDANTGTDTADTPRTGTNEQTAAQNADEAASTLNNADDAVSAANNADDAATATASETANKKYYDADGYEYDDDLFSYSEKLQQTQTASETGGKKYYDADGYEYDNDLFSYSEKTQQTQAASDWQATSLNKTQMLNNGLDEAISDCQVMNADEAIEWGKLNGYTKSEIEASDAYKALTSNKTTTATTASTTSTQTAAAQTASDSTKISGLASEYGSKTKNVFYQDQARGFIRSHKAQITSQAELDEFLTQIGAPKGFFKGANYQKILSELGFC